MSRNSTMGSSAQKNMEKKITNFQSWNQITQMILKLNKRQLPSQKCPNTFRSVISPSGAEMVLVWRPEPRAGNALHGKWTGLGLFHPWGQSNGFKSFIKKCEYWKEREQSMEEGGRSRWSTRDVLSFNLRRHIAKDKPGNLVKTTSILQTRSVCDCQWQCSQM